MEADKKNEKNNSIPDDDDGIDGGFDVCGGPDECSDRPDPYFFY